LQGRNETAEDSVQVTVTGLGYEAGASQLQLKKPPTFSLTQVFSQSVSTTYSSVTDVTASAICYMQDMWWTK